MKKKLQFDLKSITVAVFFVTAFLFVAFSVYMAAFKDNTVHSDRNIASYKTVNYTEHEKQGNFKLEFIPLEEAVDIIQKNIPNNEKNKVIAPDMIMAITEYLHQCED